MLRSLILIIGIVYLQEAVKIVPLVTINQLLKKNKNVKQVSYLPIKVNQGGVMPIIFASTILSFLFLIFNSITNFLHISIHKFTSCFPEYSSVLCIDVKQQLFKKHTQINAAG